MLCLFGSVKHIRIPVLCVHWVVELFECLAAEIQIDYRQIYRRLHSKPDLGKRRLGSS